MLQQHLIDNKDVNVHHVMSMGQGKFPNLSQMVIEPMTSQTLAMGTNSIHKVIERLVESAMPMKMFIEY